jgi:CBS domain-containing protein
MSWRAEDIMNQDVLCVYEDMTLRDLAEVFLRKQIAAAPVTTRDGLLKGVVSQTDLLRRTLRLDDELVPDSDFYRVARIDGRRLPKAMRLDPGDAPVADIMNTTIHSVGDRASIEKVARLMRLEKIQRVIVERRGRVVGVISAFDLIDALSTKPMKKPKKKAGKKK